MPDTLMTTDAPRDEAPLTRSRELDKLAAALAKAQGEIEGAIKDKSNPAFRSKYADLGAVWDAIREPFSKNGLSVVQFPRRDGNSVEVETVLLHASGQWMSGTFSVPTAKQDAHGFGSATTYARRFSLSAVCGVAPVDDDGNAAVGPAGSAGGGTHFRPERRGGSNWVEEARNDGTLDETREKGKLPAAKGQAAPINTAAAGSAIKRLEWVKASVAFLKDASTDGQIAREWWIENKARVDVIETALPTEYERLLDAYNEALERKVDA